MRRTLLFSLSTALACSGDEMTPPPSGLCLNITGNIDAANGLSIKKPENEVTGCTYLAGATPDEASCQQKAPDLTCVGQNEPLGTPINVTFTGCVTSFGLEAQSDDLTVTVLRERMGNQQTDPGYDLNGAAGMQTENTPAARIASAISTQVPKEQCSDLGAFSLTNVPTETALIVRVTDQHFEPANRQYVDTYQYNVVLRNSQIREGPTATSPLVTDPSTYCQANACYVVDDVNTVIETTFKTIALTAGVSQIDGSNDLYDGVGQGHVAGEVQDCTSNDTLQNAVVALSQPVKKLAYFNVDFPPSIGNLEDPKVDQSRTRTNGDGLYAAIAVDTQDGGQPVQIGAAITTSVCGDDGVCRCEAGKENPAWTAADANEAQTRVLGSREIFVFPDSITILTFDRVLYTTN